MRFIDHYEVKGRGHVFYAVDAPTDIKCGEYVRQGEHRWLIAAIERYAITRPQTKVGLLLRTKQGQPLPKLEECWRELGELESSMKLFRSLCEGGTDYMSGCVSAMKAHARRDGEMAVIRVAEALLSDMKGREE